MSVCTVQVLFADHAEALRIGRLMVEERLAACVNIGAPCTSVYWWNGEVAQANEVPASFKTSVARADSLIARVAGLHSYDTPAITMAGVERLLARYGDWVESEVR